MMKRKTYVWPICLVLVLLFGLFTTAYAWSEALDERPRTVKLNDLIYRDYIATMHVDKIIPASAFETEPVYDPRLPTPEPTAVPEYINGYIICTVVDPIKNIKKGTYGFATFDINSFQVNAVYYMGLSSRSSHSNYVIVEEKTGYPMPYDMYECRKLDQTNTIYTDITVEDVKAWKKQSIDERYKNQKIYIVQVSKDTMIQSSDWSAQLSRSKAYKDDLLVMLDRSPVNYYDNTLGRDRLHVYILYNGQEGLIPVASLMQKDKKIVKSEINSKMYTLKTIEQSYYVYDSTKNSNNRVGVIRQGQIMAIKSIKNQYEQMPLPNGRLGYTSSSALTKK